MPSDALVNHGVAEGTAGFLSKPFTPQSLVREVRCALHAAPAPCDAELSFTVAAA